MKRLTRRLLSLLLAVCLILSLMTGLALLVHAVGENAIRNWGTRDVVCTQLSASASSYYTGQYTYASLKALSGASSTANSLTAAQNNNLYTALYTLMSSTHDSAAISGITYSSHSTWYAYTDCENGDTSGNMKLLWAGGYRTWDGNYVNREHVWCKSHATYVETYGGADLHHLRPASAYVNQQPHNNRPYGSANDHGGTTCVDENNNFGGWYLNATSSYPEGQYEPPDNAKGDCARIILYVYTRWKQPNLYTSLDTSSSAYLNFVEQTPEGTCDGTACIESLETLLAWCEMDPVDTWEMGRNDSVQSIQGNRNVFIDYPELAWYMFGLTPPSTMTTPSGDAANNGVSYAITNVTVNNQNYGTATITNSNTVTVSPAAGCYIQSATSTSGTCSINGNVITVNGMTANATVNVVLAQNASYTISFTVPAGVTQSSMTGYANDTITLPTPTGNPTANAHNYEFYGWVSASVNDTTTMPTHYTAGSSYTITGNETLIALYRYTENTGSGAVGFDPSGNGGTFVLAADVNGTYYGLPVSGLGGARPVGSTITVTNGAVTTANASGYEWTLAKSGNDFTISNGNGTYLTYSGSSTSLASDSSAYTWTIAANDATTYTIVPSGGSTRSLIFRAGSYNYFAAYATTNLTSNPTEYFAIEILPIGSGAATQTYYTTNLTSACSHTYGSFTSNNDGTHSKTCSLCGDVVTESCSYTTSVSGLTTTYTCTVCGYSYATTLNSYTVTYNILGTVSGTDTVTEGNSVTLPTAPAYTGYTFEGWATSTINPESTTVPTTLTGTYTPTANVTLYAVYSRVDQNGGSTTSYVLVTDTNQLSSGANLIIAAKDYDYAMADIFGTYYRNQASVTKSGNTLTPGSGVIPFTLGTGSSTGTWSLYDTTNNAYLTAYVSGSYYDLGTEASVTANSSFSISVSATDGTASLTTNNGTCVVKYYRSSSYQEYKCVSSTASSTYNLDITLYVETTVPNAVTYYTTQPVVTCAHTNTSVVGGFAASCTGQGYTGDEICNSCGATVTAGSVIPALGHNYTSAVTTAATCTSAGVTTYTCSRCNDSYTDNTVPAALGHNYTSAVTTAATCTSAGVTTYTCSRCNDSYTDNTAPAALGHSYTSAVTTAPTCGTAGVRTYTCSRCNDSYTEAIPATGNHSYGACISNNNGTHSQTCSVCGDMITNSCTYTDTTHGITVTHTCTACGYSYTSTLSTWTVTYLNLNVASAVTCISGNSITFPSSDGVSLDGTDYTFVGWVTARVEPTTTAPSTIYKPGESFTPEEDVTFYALYSSSVAGDPVEEFRLVTATDQLAEGDEIVIAARSAAYAILLNGTSVSRTSVSKSNSNANLTPNSATIFTLESSTTVSGAWCFRSGNYYFCVSRQSITGSASSGYPGAWTIRSIDSSNGGTVMSAKRSASEQVRYLRYTNNAFSTTSSSTNTICLYKKYITTPQITSYTTELEAHVHQYTSEVTTPATCSENGVITYTCSCGDTYTEAIAALGHDIVEDAAVAATCTDSGLTAGSHCTRCDYAVAQETVPALGHNYIAGTPVAATCTAAGYTPYTCDRCGDSYDGDIVPALGHNMVEDAAVAATCTESGLTAGEHCTRCDYAVAQETVPALGHNYIAGTPVAATCTAAGYTPYTCDRCGDSYNGDAVAALGHDLVTDPAVAATCTESGLTAGEHCTRCDYAVAQETVPALGHNYVAGTPVTGTCTDAGYTPYTCDRCGDSYDGDIVPALGHNMVEDAAVAATCTESGLTAGEHCTRCDYAVAQETVPALGHNYIAGTPVAATCTAAGYTPYTCDRCGDSYNGDAVAALGHDLVTDPAVAATCTESGLTAGEHCTRCDYAVAQETVPALGHNYVASTPVAATCTAAGYTPYTCDRCGDSYNGDAVAALGHDLVYEDNQDGLTHIVSCSRCYDYYIAAESHTFVNGACTLCGAEQRTLKLVSASPVLNDKIDMIYAAYIPDGYSNPYVVFVFNGVTTTVTEHTTDEYNRELFVFNDINPQCMGDNISATLYATREGSVESYSVPTYSVRQYCVNKLADEPPIPLQAIVSNLLAYGAAAQVYMNYKTDALVTSGDDIVDPMYYDFSDFGPISGYDASFEGTAASDVFWVSANLTLTNSVAMNFRFYAESAADLTVTVSCNGESRTISEFTSVGDGIYEFSFTDINANEFGSAVTVSFARNGQTVGNALTYSVNAYVQSKQNDSNTALQNLVRALYLYGVSAEDFGGYVG